MQSFKKVTSIVFLFFFILACAAPVTTLKTDYETIQKIYPRHKNIIKVIFKEQTYFVLADYGKIKKIIKIIESEENDSRLWIVIDSNRRLDEVIQYPEMKRYDLTDKQISLADRGPFTTEKYSAEIDQLRADLAVDWEILIQKITMRLHKVDAASQATP